MPSFVIFGLLPSPSSATYSLGNFVFSLEVESVLVCVLAVPEMTVLEAFVHSSSRTPCSSKYLGR